MFEDKSYDVLLNDGLSQVSDSVAKSEGSLVYNAISAMAYELNRLYVELDWIMKQSDPAKADYDSLVKMAAARAVYPKEATKAIFKLTAPAACPIGSRFRLSGYTFAITEEIEGLNVYAAECTEPGSAPNTLRGQCVPVDFIQGVNYATITDLLTAGSNADTKEELYQKYMESFTSLSFSGNATAYKAEVLKFAGVGGVKIYPVWNGPGTVKCVLIGSDYRKVSDYTVDDVKEGLDPEPSKGYGIVPIGHTVTVESVKEKTVSIHTSIEFRPGFSWETSKADIEAAIEHYIESVRKAWSTSGADEGMTVYVSRIESAVLDVDGVKDISGTTLNGSASNVALASDEIPILGGVSV